MTMSQVYTTQELIQILADERRACLKGERLKLEVNVSGNPVIDQFIKTEGLQKFTAYQDFKASIHEYQRKYKVSGITSQIIDVKGKTLHYPVVDSQLITLPSDLGILKAAKSSILNFWYEVTGCMDLYLNINNSKQYQAIEEIDVERIAYRTEWCSLWKWENPQFLEIILQLGWGKVELAAYRRNFPVSGSEYIHAVNPGNVPIG